MSAPRLEFGFEFGAGAAARRRDPEAPFRLLVIGAFSGSHGAARASALSTRKLRAVDLDRFDRVFAEYAPAIEVTAPRQPVPVAFDSMEDFHPDRRTDIRGR